MVDVRMEMTIARVQEASALISAVEQTQQMILALMRVGEGGTATFSWDLRIEPLMSPGSVVLKAADWHAPTDQVQAILTVYRAFREQAFRRLEDMGVVDASALEKRYLWQERVQADDMGRDRQNVG